MATVQRTPVSSTAFKSIGYDPHTRTLAVEFQSGGVHHFEDVDPDFADSFQSSASPGGFFHRHIRGHYLSTKQEG